MKKLLLFPLLLVTCFCLAQDAKEIIGKPIKIGNLLVAQHDFPNQMKWEDAKKACALLGKGWRLPNENELATLYLKRAKIGGFPGDSYWSSTERNDNYAVLKGTIVGLQDFGYKYTEYYVRAVRTIK